MRSRVLVVVSQGRRRFSLYILLEAVGQSKRAWQLLTYASLIFKILSRLYNLIVRGRVSGLKSSLVLFSEEISYVSVAGRDFDDEDLHFEIEKERKRQTKLRSDRWKEMIYDNEAAFRFVKFLIPNFTNRWRSSKSHLDLYFLAQVVLYKKGIGRV